MIMIMTVGLKKGKKTAHDGSQHFGIGHINQEVYAANNNKLF